jgi:tetratricopeptide (TPR) repeat protein
MATPCDNLEPFVDGELPPAEAEAFRHHLPDCARCHQDLTELLQIGFVGRRHRERAQASVPARRPPPPALSSWRRPLQMAAALAAVLLGLGALRFLPSSGQDPWLTKLPYRLSEARISYPDADHYRPPVSRMMGTDDRFSGPAHTSLASLEERNDRHGLAAAYLASGNRHNAEQALKYLEVLGDTPDLESERATAWLHRGKPEQALRHADAALAKRLDHPQAIWNRGLALRDLGLPLVAARAFTAVSALKEPGWGEEAATRAEELRRITYDRRERWQTIFDAGPVLVEGRLDSLPEGFGQAPIARLFFYDAVRAAPSPERVNALLPLARELDARAGGQRLEAYVLQIAGGDFSQRASLAQEYATLVRGNLPPALKARILERILQSREDDLILGGLIRAGAVAQHLDLFEAKATASGDPWFKILAAQERAAVDKAAGRWRSATRLLLDALPLCSEPGIEYRCLSLQLDLSKLYIKLHQLDAARKHTEEGWREARKHNEWRLERDLLWNLANIARLANDAPLARARFEEYLEGDRDRSDTARRVHENFAEIALKELRVEEARRELDAALAAGKTLSHSGAFTLADLSRIKSAPEDEAHLLGAVAALPSNFSPGEHAVIAHTLGRFYIERDRERGRALLWRAIEEAGAPGLEEDLGARRARAYSFTSLIFEAGRRSAFTEALELFARERGRELPRQCLLAVTADSERILFLAHGAQGELLGHHETRSEPLPERLDGLVPEPILGALRACPRVEVFARPPLHGRAGLLPADLAWSYLTHSTAPRPPQAGRAIHLIVSDIPLPFDSEVPRLNSWPPSVGPNEQRFLLSGTEATPTRVVAAMRDATEIDLVTHGFIHESSSASYLQLAPDPSGGELTVPQVREVRLRGSPFVVLAACHAAHTSYALHEPLSLPAAFIQAGARGVLAATEQIPDLEASAFFNAIREQLRAGVPPAVALRDERVRWLSQGRGKTWLDRVLLFE